MTKRTRNEKLVQKALHVLHFHKVQDNRDSIHFNTNQRGNPVLKKNVKKMKMGDKFSPRIILLGGNVVFNTSQRPQTQYSKTEDSDSSFVC